MASFSFLFFVLCGFSAPPAHAQQDPLATTRPPAPNALPPALKDVGIDQRLGHTLPLDLEMVDESGKTVRLGTYFGERPVIVVPVYYECPMLCTLTLNGLARGLAPVSLDVGTDFDVVCFSIDPDEGPGLALAKKDAYVERYDRPGSERGWHFLTGSREAIATLTRAIGFRFAHLEATGEYAHAAGIMVATPSGRLSHYFYGNDFSPRDVQLGLVEASDGKVGSPVDRVLLFCFQYDPTTGKYGAAVMRMVRIGGALTLVLLVLLIVVLLRRERRRAAALNEPAEAPCSKA